MNFAAELFVVSTGVIVCIVIVSQLVAVCFGSSASEGEE